MDGFAHRVSVQSEGTGNVLIITLLEEEHLLPYCCKIMENNRIPGLLPMNHQTVDGKIRLRYAIGGKMTLHEYMSRHRLPYEKGVMLLRNLSDSLLHLNEYFLSPAMCELNPELVYVGDGLRTFLPCIPVEYESGQNHAARLKGFYEALLSNYFATDDCSSYDAMFKWVYKTPLFDLQTFRDEFLGEDKSSDPLSPIGEKGKHAKAPEAKQTTKTTHKNSPAEEDHSLTEILNQKLQSVQKIYPSAAEDKGVFEEVAAKLSTHTEDKAKKSSNGGISFAVPFSEGSAPKPEPQKEKKPKDKSAKRGLWSFGKTENNEKAEENRNEDKKINFGQNLRKTPPKQKETPRPAKSTDEDWGEGTILVDQEENTPAEPKTSAEPQCPNLTHKAVKIPLTSFPFKLGKYNTTIELDYAVYDNPKVSRNHATILQKDGQYYLRDNQSRNGTFLNGQALLPLQPAQLKDGDEIRLYDETLIFHLS